MVAQPDPAVAPAGKGIGRCPQCRCSLEAVESATLEWVNWFDNHRLLDPIGICRRPRQKRATMPSLRNPSWRRDSSQSASGEAGAVQNR
jgi:hypothetical protein